MGFVETSDVSHLLQDTELVSEIAKTVAEDPEAVDALMDQIAGELHSNLEESARGRRQIIRAAMNVQGFRSKLATKIAENLADD